MKFTPTLFYRHPKYYYYAYNYGWGLPKFKELFHKKWKYEIGINKKLPIEDYVTERKFEIPSGYIIKNPIDFMQENRLPNLFTPYPKLKPWPFNKKEEPGSRLDPLYKEKRELIFNRQHRLFEGFKGVLNFSNTILESDESLPDEIMKNEDKLILNDEILNVLEKRLEWSDKLDSFLARNNLKFEFPRLNKWAIPAFGATLDRREVNVLKTYADCSELLLANQFNHLYYPRILSPKYEIAFQRNDHRCFLDLRCDFLTLKQNPIEEMLSVQQNDQKNDNRKEVLKLVNHVKSDNLFSKNFESTKQKELIDLSPIDWKINFELSHFYPDDDQMNKTPKITEQDVDVVYLGNNFNIHKATPDRIIKGKLLIYLYGYAVGRARYLYGNINNFKDESNYKILDKPITIKGVFANYSKHNLGFACFQLNTLSFNSDIKNQVWFDGPYDTIEDRELILKKIALMNLNSYESVN